MSDNGLEYIGDEQTCCISSIAELKKCENVLLEKTKCGYTIIIDNQVFTNVQPPQKISGRYGSTYIIYL